MPRLVLKYSGNIREPATGLKPLFAKLHSALAEVGGFRAQDSKSRFVRMPDFFIGDGRIEQSFVNLDIRTFFGKSTEEKKAVSEEALALLCGYFETRLAETACDISVQVTELDLTVFARARSLSTN